jgi:hypothetical protein
VHNTQPWRFLLSPDAVELYADRSRQLSVLDPAGRQLVISCGCALSNMRVALAGMGHRVEVARFPDPLRGDLLARVTVRGSSAEPDPLAALDAVIELRRSNRRRFADEPVPSEVVSDLVAAAATEDAQLFPIDKPGHRLITASLSQQADRAQWAAPGYRAELRRWTTNDVRRLDGVPSDAIPRVDGSADDDIPIRDFDTTGKGALPAATRSTMRQCLLLLGTTTDAAAGWLRAGEALERVLLEAAGGSDHPQGAILGIDQLAGSLDNPPQHHRQGQIADDGLIGLEQCPQPVSGAHDIAGPVDQLSEELIQIQ